jgi:predicted O-methyltransferase YrrM
MIVLNGQPLVQYNLEALYPYAHQIIVVEGAARAAAAAATPAGHSTDGTTETLRRFKETHDPENKVILVTAEDLGSPNGFWPEKTEMSQAYAARATGDWLWQVDSDEFYRDEDMRAVLEMLAGDPSIGCVSFPYKQFWGGFDYVERGDWFDYAHPNFDRLFRWGPGHRYVEHRPPTVVDERGVDLRRKKWIRHTETRRRGIFLYHYSYVFPTQAQEKVKYYSHVAWTDHFRDMERWYQDSYVDLARPFHVGEGLNYLTWLERHRGPEPRVISRLRADLRSGALRAESRPTGDIEALLSSPSYELRKQLVSAYARLRWKLWRAPAHRLAETARKVPALRSMARRLIELRDRRRFVRRWGSRYSPMAGYLAIHGWLTEKEATTLYDLARKLSAENPVVVEIGSWQGKSSVILAKGVAETKGGCLYCIDPFNGAGGASVYQEEMSKLDRPLLEIFGENMERNGVGDVVRPLVGTSDAFTDRFSAGIDLLFIDGDHSYEAVMKDFEGYARSIKVGGQIAFHDVDFDPAGEPTGAEEFLGPAQVIKQRIVNNPEWAEHVRIDGLFVARKVR